MLKLTWYVSVTILKGMEVVHEFFDGDLEGRKQASVFKESVGDLKPKSNCQSICEFIFEMGKTVSAVCITLNFSKQSIV